MVPAFIFQMETAIFDSLFEILEKENLSMDFPNILRNKIRTLQGKLLRKFN